MDGDESFGFRFHKDADSIFNITSLYGSSGILNIMESLIKLNDNYDYVVNNLELPYYSNIKQFDLYNSKIQEIINQKFPSAKKILLSSQMVYSPGPDLKNEEYEIKPVNEYGESKIKAEIMLNGTEDSIILRRGIIYGKCTSNIYTDILAAIRGKIKMRLDDSILLNPVLNADLSLSLISLIKSSSKGVYNAAGSELMTLYGMASGLCKLLDRENNFEPLNGNKKVDYNMDSSKIIKHTGIEFTSFFEMDFMDFIL